MLTVSFIGFPISFVRKLKLRSHRHFPADSSKNWHSFHFSSISLIWLKRKNAYFSVFNGRLRISEETGKKNVNKLKFKAANFQQLLAGEYSVSMLDKVKIKMRAKTSIQHANSWPYQWTFMMLKYCPMREREQEREREREKEKPSEIINSCPTLNFSSAWHSRWKFRIACWYCTRI